MKKYLEENIKFNSLKFTSGFYATLLLLGGIFGMIINFNVLQFKKITLLIFGGGVLAIGAIIYLILLQNRIKEDINKFKKYE
ncbi:MAG: hypothetical protein SFY32_12725 [Bacteroidota bacterium]|nr:hypothetical protein [Bacteroidota bacterium]